MVQDKSGSDVRCDFRAGKIYFPVDCTQISLAVRDSYGFRCCRDIRHCYHYPGFRRGSASNFFADRLFSVQCVHSPFFVEQRAAYPYNGSRRNMVVFHYVPEPFALPAYTVSLSVHTLRRG